MSPSSYKYETVADLIAGYASGEITQDDILWLDNDTTFMYIGDEDKGERPVKVFDMHPYDLLHQLLDYVGIPAEGV
jgi:hypothetical protein